MNNVFGFIVSEEPVEEYFGYVLEYGVGHLEIDLKKKHSLIQTFTPERMAGIREFSRENGISLSLHPPYNMNLCARGPFLRRFHIAYIQKCIYLADEIGATYITLHLGSFNRTALWATPRHHALGRLLKVLRSVLPICRKYGVSLALENMIPIPPEAGFSFLGDNIEDFQYIFSRIESDNIKMCLDIGHANTSEGVLEYVDKLGENIIGVHVHDNHGDFDEHLEVGQGTVPWKELIPAIQRTGFTGPYVSETFKSKPHLTREHLLKYISGSFPKYV